MVLTCHYNSCRYVIVGDAAGSVFVFRPAGELVLEFSSGRSSPVTALSAAGAFL